MYNKLKIKMSKNFYLIDKNIFFSKLKSKIKAKNERKSEWQPQHATSGFTRLRHYPRLKIFTTFAAGCSLGSAWKPQPREAATPLHETAGQVN
jgi:hypothetical protein